VVPLGQGKREEEKCDVYLNLPKMLRLFLLDTAREITSALGVEASSCFSAMRSVRRHIEVSLLLRKLLPRLFLINKKKETLYATLPMINNCYSIGKHCIRLILLLPYAKNEANQTRLTLSSHVRNVACDQQQLVLRIPLVRL
jgi:transcriptional regulator of aromatic amino acid metabolism